MRNIIRLTALIGFAATVGAACTLPTMDDELFQTEFHFEGIVSSKRDNSPISGATVSLIIDTVDGLHTAQTARTDVNGRYTISHSFNMGRDRCPPLWIASSATGYVPTPPRDPRFRPVCEAMTMQGKKQIAPSQTINVTLDPV